MNGLLSQFRIHAIDAARIVGDAEIGESGSDRVEDLLQILHTTHVPDRVSDALTYLRLFPRLLLRLQGLLQPDAPIPQGTQVIEPPKSFGHDGGNLREHTQVGCKGGRRHTVGRQRPM